MPSEKDVTLARKGNKEAFVRLIQACELSMYRVAKSMVRSDETVADVMQETILKAYDAIGSLREPKYFKTWLIRILINQCQQVLRHDAKVVPLGDWMDQIGDEPSYDHLDIEEALHALKEEHRVAISLFYLEDMLIKDIAALLEVPEGTVKSRLSVARKQLKELLMFEGERGMNYGLK